MAWCGVASHASPDTKPLEKNVIFYLFINTNQSKGFEFAYTAVRAVNALLTAGPQTPILAFVPPPEGGVAVP